MVSPPHLPEAEASALALLPQFDLSIRWSTPKSGGGDLWGRTQSGDRIAAEVLRLRGPNRTHALEGAAARGALQLLHVQADQRLVILLIDKLSQSARDTVHDYLGTYAPDVGWALIDENGAGEIHLPRLEISAVIDSAPKRQETPAPARVTFTDLQTWMVKLMLLRNAPDWAWAGPRTHFKTITELAGTADVSIASAHRFVTSMEAAGFMRLGARGYELVRVEALLEAWRASYRSQSPVLTAIRSAFEDDPERIGNSLRSDRVVQGGDYAALRYSLKHTTHPRFILWFEDPLRAELDRHDLVPTEGGSSPLWAAQTKPRSSIARGAIQADGQRFVDPLQLMLESSLDPKRGAEQSDFVLQRILAWWDNG